MLTEKDYCDYDTCVALKELGFKVPTSAYYMPNNNQLIFVSNPLRGGYVIDCFYSRNSLPKDVMTSNYIDAPTTWEAQKWLREEKNIIVEPNFAYMDEKRNKYYWVQIVTDIRFDDENYIYECDTMKFEESKGYEKALSEGIKQAVEILKESL